MPKMGANLDKIKVSQGAVELKSTACTMLKSPAGCVRNKPFPSSNPDFTLKIAEIKFKECLQTHIPKISASCLKKSLLYLNDRDI